MGVKLHFVYRRLHARVSQNQLQLGDRHIGRADMSNQLPLDQHFHPAPSLHVALMNVGLGVRAARRHVAARRVEVWERPMHEEQIKIVETQVGQRFLARSDHVVFAVLVVPQFRCDPEFLALFPPWIISSSDAPTAASFLVHRRAIEMPVAHRGCALDRGGDLPRPNVVGPEIPARWRASWLRCTIFAAGSPPDW